MIYTVDTEAKTLVIRGEITVTELLVFIEDLHSSMNDYKILVENIGPMQIKLSYNEILRDRIVQPYDSTAGNPYRVNYTTTNDIKD